MPATRFKIPDLPDFFFEIKNEENPNSNPQKLSINNISSSGVGFDKGIKKDWPNVGEEIEGTIIKGKFKIETTAKVIHKTENIVGCQFLDSLSKIESLIGDELLKDLFPSLK